MTTTTAWIPVQSYARVVSGIATVDINETASLTIPCGGRSVVRIGVPTITSGTLTFNVVPYPGATARLLKDEAGTTVTVAASTGGFTVDIPELTGAYSFTIICGAAQGAAREFEVQCIGDGPALALSNVTLNTTDQWQTAIYAQPTIASATPVAWTTANSPVTLFTVTGTVMCRVFGTVGATAFTSTAGTGTLALGVTGATGAFIAATTANNTTNFVANAAWVDTTPAVTAEALASSSGWFLTTGDIILTIATNNMTAGAAHVYCQWIPVSTDGAVV